MKPLVTIVIPAYNSERYILRALTSAMGQTYENLQIIVVDDGSTDRTADLVRSVGDRRITYVHQSNAGQGPARNRGIAAADGSLITFLDSDDWYDPPKVERQVAALTENARYGVAYCRERTHFLNRPGAVYRRHEHLPSGNILPALLRSPLINPNTAMLRRSVLRHVGGFNETRYFPEEWELWLRIALAGYEFVCVDEELVSIEVRPDSNTTMDIQPVLKGNAIEMLRRLVPAPIGIDGTVYDVESTIRALHLKRALALLMVGQRRAFLSELVKASPAPRAVTSLLGVLAMLLPAALVRRAWRLAQLRRYRPVAVLP